MNDLSVELELFKANVGFNLDRIDELINPLIEMVNTAEADESHKESMMSMISSLEFDLKQSVALRAANRILKGHSY